MCPSDELVARQMKGLDMPNSTAPGLDPMLQKHACSHEQGTTLRVVTRADAIEKWEILQVTHNPARRYEV